MSFAPLRKIDTCFDVAEVFCFNGSEEILVFMKLVYT